MPVGIMSQNVWQGSLPRRRCDSVQDSGDASFGNSPRGLCAGPAHRHKSISPIPFLHPVSAEFYNSADQDGERGD